MMCSFIAFAAMVFVFAFSHTSYAQTSLDLSAGGALVLGNDTSNCSGANVGGIRYGNVGGCPNIGDTCSDGSIYAGLSPDGNVPMYTTPANAGGIPWNNGNTSGIVNLYTPITESFVSGEASTAAFIGVDSDSSTGGIQPFQAPEYCYYLNAHGHSDWYVPSENEFEVLRTNYVAIGIPSGNYWTSTEVCCDAMFYRSIPSGGGSGVKRFSNIVRCVRKGEPGGVQVCKPSVQSGCPNIGDTCADGSIYAGLSPDGNVPMYTTPADAPTRFHWNNNNTDGRTDTSMVNCTTSSPGTETSCRTGELNTAILVSEDSDSITAGVQPHQAAAYCDSLTAHGYSNWYLPALDELNVLYNNRAAIGGFGTERYWSSSERQDTSARRQDFADGDQVTNGSKANNFFVRCVRKPYGWSNWGE